MAIPFYGSVSVSLPASDFCCFFYIFECKFGCKCDEANDIECVCSIFGQWLQHMSYVAVPFAHWTWCSSGCVYVCSRAVVYSFRQLTYAYANIMPNNAMERDGANSISQAINVLHSCYWLCTFYFPFVVVGGGGSEFHTSNFFFRFCVQNFNNIFYLRRTHTDAFK